MRRGYIFTQAAVLFLLIACQGQAQFHHDSPTLTADPSPQPSDLTADQLIAKFEAARGGEAKLKAVRTVRETGEWSSNVGSPVPVTVEIANGRFMRRIAQGTDVRFINVVDGATTWEMIPRNGITKPTPMSEKDAIRFRRIADPQGPLVDAQAKGHKVETVGKLAWRGNQVYKLKVTFADGGPPSYVYLDAKTFLVSRVVNSQFVPQLNKNIEMELVYGDYRDIDGLKWAYSEKSSAPEANFAQSITWSKVEINTTLDEADFKGPKS